ncbi:hypothetical protein [Streptomyces sp. NPDC060027]|uniref:hypothetical protein n=1 Tax=Streptomyces sp. NPDC060027 TaxID=3347040 RepID=UPI00368FD9B0
MRLHLLRAVGVSAIALAPIIGLTTPANASVERQQCHAMQKVEIGTTGLDVDIQIKLCVQQDTTGVYRAFASFWWQDAGSYKFNNLDLHVRLERYDVVRKGAVCDFTDEVNSTQGFNLYCETTWTSAAPPLTTDATLLYDTADDGKGEFRWDLTGTPAL